MRRMLVAISSALLLGAMPAVAAQYECQVVEDNVVKKTCTIDSAATATCEHKLSSSLSATCAASDPFVWCAFHNGPLAAAEIGDEIAQLAAPADAKLRKAAKGFQAAALGVGFVGIGYVEKKGATQYAALCKEI